MNNQALWVAAALVGFFAIPVLADLSPTAVNGFLLLVLLSSLLLTQETWLPYLRQLEVKPGTPAFDKAHHKGAQ